VIEPSYFEIKELKVYPSRNEVEQKGRIIHLTPKEMGVLVTLYSHANETISREKILNRVWGPDQGNDLGLTQAISRLRKIFKNQTPLEVIVTVPKVGYRLVTGDRVTWPDGNRLVGHIIKYKKEIFIVFIVVLSLVILWLLFNRPVIIKKRIILPDAVQSVNFIEFKNANLANAPSIQPASPGSSLNQYPPLLQRLS
jgi:DNA-binding winged helix-turn-helix (wHTH) protein